MKKFWSEKEINFLKNKGKYFYISELALKLNRSEISVEKKIRRLDYNFKRKKTGPNKYTIYKTKPGLNKGCKGLKLDKHPKWKGGRRIDSNGYILIRKEEHKFKRPQGHYVPEHRIIMENNIGRYLKKDEIVHHINRDKQDNRICNLQLLTVSEHCAIHNQLRNKVVNESD